MKDKFKFYMPTRIYCEAGSCGQLDRFIDGSRVLIISDPFLFGNGTAEKIGAGMTGKDVYYFSDIEPNPSCESVDAAAALARRIRADSVVGLGGGSSLDVAKIVACLTDNAGSIYDYYSGGTRTLIKRRTALICIPTTAGTGSEVTNVGVFTNRETHIKMPMVNDEFWPDWAVIDAELTYTLPPAVTASTGMDAFCHAIEAYWNKESVPLCDYMSMGAMKLILDNIKLAYDAPDNARARGNMILAALTAGVSFSQTRTTGIHAVSFPLTTEFGASHGTACAITLPAFIRRSREQAADKMDALAAYLGCADTLALADNICMALRLSRRIYTEFLRAYDINDAGGHAPPVIERLIGFGCCIVLKGAVQDTLNKFLIKASPVPHRHDQIDRGRGALPVQSEASGWLVGNNHLSAGNIIDSPVAKGLFRLGIPDGGPFQIHPGIGIDHLCPQGEGVDIGGHTVDGIIGDITELTAAVHGCGHDAGEKFGLIHTAVIGSYVAVTRIQRAVKNFCVPVVDGSLQAGNHQFRCRSMRPTTVTFSSILSRYGRKGDSFLHICA